MNMHEGGKVISFTSGKGGSGKTSLIANIGIYLAKIGKKVLLIDWDFFTRGLSYYVLEGKEHTNINAGLLEALESKSFESLRPSYVRENLDIFVPSSDTRRVINLSSPRIDNEIVYKGLDYIIQENKGKYEFILIDLHSGTEFFSLIPTFFSDEYIIVSEEDRTSWRISSLLRDTIKENFENFEKQKEQYSKYTPQFVGFILNKTIIEPNKDILKFLEKQVFSGKCILVIPFDIRVRRAFIRDKFVIEEYPSTKYSYRIKELIEKYFEIKIPPIRSFAEISMNITRKMLRDPLIFALILVMYFFILYATLYPRILYLPIFMAIFVILFSAVIITLLERMRKI